MRKVLYILGQLEDADLQWLLDAGEARGVPAGAVVIQEGEPLDSLFIVIDGELTVVKSGTELARLGTGEVIGEMSFLDSRPPSATVSAQTESTVYAISQARLSSKLKADPEFAARFYRALCVFLANRLDRTDAMIGAGPRVASGPPDPSADSISPDALDSVFLAGTRFDWFLDRVRGR